MSPPGSRPRDWKRRGGEEGGDMLVPGGGAAAVELVVGEKGHVGADFVLEGSRGVRQTRRGRRGGWRRDRGLLGGGEEREAEQSGKGPGGAELKRALRRL